MCRLLISNTLETWGTDENHMWFCVTDEWSFIAGCICILLVCVLNYFFYSWDQVPETTTTIWWIKFGNIGVRLLQKYFDTWNSHCRTNLYFHFCVWESSSLFIIIILLLYDEVFFLKKTEIEIEKSSVVGYND